MSETIEVSGESPLIDVKQNAAGANVQAEIIERIPKGRDFAAVVTSAPGITSEARNRGIQIDGASGADNRFLIDGVDTTNLLNGTSGKALPPDFVDTVQVKASGYTAEYRASLGGVISAITKSGGNAYHGERRHLLHQRQSPGRRPADAAAESRRTERRGVRDDATRRLLESRADLRSRRSDPQGSPVVLRRLRPAAGPTGPAPCCSATPDQLGTFSQKPTINIVNYNVTRTDHPQPARRDSRRRTSATKAATRLPGSGPHGVSTANPALFPSVDPPRRVERFVLGRARLGRRTTKTYVNVTVTRFKVDQHDVGTFSTALRHTFQGVELPVRRHPRRRCRTCNGFADNPSSSQFVHGGLSRFNFNADVTRYGHVARPAHCQGRLPGRAHRRQHAVGRAGARRCSCSGTSRTRSTTAAASRGTYGYYNVVRSVTIGDIESNNVGLFVQDAWTLNRKLTLNLGVRDRERRRAVVPRSQSWRRSSTSATRSRPASGSPTTCRATASGRSTAAGACSTT